MKRPNRSRESRTPRERIFHRAQFMGESPDVSALCYPEPRAINFRKAGWTMCNESVTCSRCRALLPSLPPSEQRENDNLNYHECDA